jgi:hypothetical protein
LFFFSQYSIAEEKKDAPTKTIPVETMHQIDSIDKILEETKELELLADSISRQKYSDCIKAFGNQKFCQCLRDKSPIGIDFTGYVKVVTTTKEELGYSKADKETKQLIDNTLNAREACVIGGDNMTNPSIK